MCILIDLGLLRAMGCKETENITHTQVDRGWERLILPHIKTKFSELAALDLQCWPLFPKTPRYVQTLNSYFSSKKYQKYLELSFCQNQM